MKIYYALDNGVFVARDLVELESEIRKFLDDKGISADVEIDRDKVVVSYPDVNDIDAAEDERIVIGFCQSRRFGKARKVVLELIDKAPANSDAHRLYAQIEMEDGNFDKAIATVKDALRFNPENLYALILLGNLLSRDKGLVEEGLVWYKKAYELYPESVLSVNNYAGALLQRGGADPSELECLFRKAIQLDPSYLNAYYGLAGLLFEKNDLQGAFDVVQEGLRRGAARVENPAPITDVMTEMLVRLAWELSKKTDMSIVDAKRAELEESEGIRIEIVEDRDMDVPARMSLAERYGRNAHRLAWNPDKTKSAGVYYLMHELEKQAMRVESKRAGRSAMFVHGKDGFGRFAEKTSSYMNDGFRATFPGADVSSVLTMLMRGMGGQLMNMPLDFFVIHRLYHRYKELRPIQVAAVVELANGALSSVMSGVKIGFPRNVVRVNRVLNAAAFMQYRDVLGLDLVDKLQLPDDELRSARTIYADCCESMTGFRAGDEWDLVRKILSQLHCEEFFAVLDESEAKKEEQRQIAATKLFQERFSSGDDLALNAAVTMFMVSAIRELRTLPEEKVKCIAAEIALLGTKGIKPDRKSGYSIPSMSDRDMGGCQMLAYYYVSWKMAFPDAVEKLGLPFEKEYAEASELADRGV